MVSQCTHSVESNSSPQSADLSDPLYYLHNFRTLVEWVHEYHRDLLSSEERNRIASLNALPEPSLALLVRMLMRRGDIFRQSRLRYNEIPSITDALAPLIEQGWITADPDLDIESLGTQLTRTELRDLLDIPDSPLSSSVGKAERLAHLNSGYGDLAQPLHKWAPTLDDRAVALNCRELFTRLQLMFFGNMNQDLSAFVLTKLGYHRFEPVPLTSDSRAFSTRVEVDLYLQLHLAREALDSELPVDEVLTLTPPLTLENPWLEQRRARILFALARRAERSGDHDRALSLYKLSGHPEARRRRFRVLELTKPEHSTYLELTQALTSCKRSAEREALERIERRLSRKLGQPPRTRLRRAVLPVIEISLPGPVPVEIGVARFLSRRDAPVYYVENSLINGLFALLCWPAIYAPLSGAFFNPFQAAPADLAGEDFVSRRHTLFERALISLQEPGYKTTILERHRAKEGVSCPFINWQVLEFGLVELALECIPPADLALFFRRLLEDIPAHRSGLPDLIQFFPDAVGKEGCTTYRLIEVKGPGDKLQDHQRRWLEYLHHRGVAVSVCYPTWS